MIWRAAGSREEVHVRRAILASLFVVAGDLARTPAAADDNAGRLQEAISRYERIVDHDGWPAVGAGPRLQLGSVGPRVAALRTQLERSGDLQGPAASSEPQGTRFDTALQTAVRRFQARHGLKADGVVGRQTLGALDVTATVRLRQLRLNLERARALAPLGNGPAILVNIPAYRLQAYDGGRPVLEMRVVVGTEYDPTPAFSDTMTFLVFRPYWNIPESIALEEMLPQLQRDPGSLQKKGIEAYAGAGEKLRRIDLADIDPARFPTSGYRLRQRPGPQNPLGNVKFMLPNAHSIYLHDTPSDGLFGAADRSFSHGCVRVAQPVELAEFVLQPAPEWNREAIRAAMVNGDEHRTVSLPRPVPVHIVYLTAWVDPDGTVQFRDDVYRLDDTGSSD
jgi:murein L,D-transpeptidase YcbB/YkuD